MTDQSALFEMPKVPGSGRLLAAAQRTIRAKIGVGALNDSHALTVATVLELARAADNGLGAVKVSIATTTLMRELREALSTLPGDAGEDDEGWGDVVETAS